MTEEYQNLVENVPEMRGRHDPWCALGADWYRGRWFQVRHARKHAAPMAGLVPGEPLADFTFNWCSRRNLKQIGLAKKELNSGET